MTLKEFIETRYWAVASATLGEQWCKHTLYLLELICRDLGSYDLMSINEEQADTWWATLRKCYRTPVTPNKVLTRLKHIYKVAVRWKAVSNNPFAHIKRVKESEHKFKALTPSQQSQLMERCGIRLQHYQVFARYTGARLSSLWKLQESDVDLNDDTITFRRAKNGEDYTTALHKDLRGHILRYKLLSGQPKQFVLYHYKSPKYVSRMFSRLKKKLSLSFRFHDYRHNLGAMLGSKFQNTRLIMDALGHKDTRMSIRYTHVTQASLKKAMEEAL